MLDHPPAPAKGAPALRSYRDLAGAASDPLAAAIMAIDGVRGVLIGDGWMTITRTDGVDWKKLKARLEATLASVNHESHPADRST